MVCMTQLCSANVRISVVRLKMTRFAMLFITKEFRQNMNFEYSEDCLYLNIYAPKNAENAPVLLYIHGGSFTGGSSNEGHISGAE